VKEDKQLPLLTLKEFFDGNDEEESIAPNQWGDGRPSLAEMWAKLREAEARPDVAWMRVQLHPDTTEDEIAGDAIAICTSASRGEIARALDTEWFCSDGVIEGWGTYKKEILADDIPAVPDGYRVVSLVWD